MVRQSHSNAVVLALAYWIANPLSHHVCLRCERIRTIVEHSVMMFAGDLSGALIMLYAVKDILAMMQTVRVSEVPPRRQD